MAKMKKTGLPVCKQCGAVGRSGAEHCVFCGAALTGETLPKTAGWRPAADSAAPKTAANVKKRPFFSVSGILALLLGLLACWLTAAVNLYSYLGIIAALLALVVAAVALGRRKSGVLAGIGLGLAIFSLLIQGLWIAAPFWLWI